MKGPINMNLVFRSPLLALPTILCALACGGGASGQSSVARDKSTQELTLAEQQAICDAHVDYALSVIGSADTWCRWQGQANANGITNEEVQASCDVEEANCLAMKNESFAA